MDMMDADLAVVNLRDARQIGGLADGNDIGAAIQLLEANDLITYHSVGPVDDGSGIAEKHLLKGAETPVLGPFYFSARDASEKMMSKFKTEDFKKLVKEAADEFYTHLQTTVENHLLSDAEINVQMQIWRNVDSAVSGLLSGQKWALDRWALGDRHDADRVREAIAKLIPKELQDRRIADLEAQIETYKRMIR